MDYARTIYCELYDRPLASFRKDDPDPGDGVTATGAPTRWTMRNDVEDKDVEPSLDPAVTPQSRYDADYRVGADDG